ncbi:MAG: serine hydrolase domain-containing protein [Planctomycetota bacterium]
MQTVRLLFSGCVIAAISIPAVPQPAPREQPPVENDGMRLSSHGNGLFYNFDEISWLEETDFKAAVTEEEGENQSGPQGSRIWHLDAWTGVGQQFGEPRFCATFINDDDCGWPHATIIDDPRDDFELAIGWLEERGYRPVSITGRRTMVGSNLSGTFLKDRYPYEWRVVLDESPAGFSTFATALEQAAFRPISVAGYDVQGAGTRLSAVYVQDNFEGDWRLYTDIAESDFSALIADEASEGRRPISVSGYVDFLTNRFACIFVEDTSGASIEVRSALTQAQLDAAHSELRDASHPNNPTGEVYRPSVVSAYGPGPDPVYVGVWETAPDRVFSITGMLLPGMEGFDTLMQQQMMARDVTAAQLTIMEAGEVKLHRAYTWAPQAQPKTRPYSRLRIGSISKTITALTLMKMIEDGESGTIGGNPIPLQLSTPFFSLDQTPAPFPPYPSDLYLATISDVLRHQVGWCDRDSNCSSLGYFIFGKDREIADALGLNLPMTREMVNAFMFDPTSWPTASDPQSVGFAFSPPGQNFAYNNFHYTMAGELIENVTLTGYENAAITRVFDPLGIDNVAVDETRRYLGHARNVVFSSDEPYTTDTLGTGWTDDLPTAHSVMPNSDEGPEFAPHPYAAQNLDTIGPTGGWAMSSLDLARLADSFWPYNTAAPSNTPLLDASSVTDWFANISTQGKLGANINYAHGIFWFTGGQNEIGHTGAVDGGRSSFKHNHADERTYAIIWNRNRPLNVGGAIEGLLDSIATLPTGAIPIAACIADWNGDLEIDAFDVLAFQEQLEVDNPATDIDGTPGLGAGDFETFLQLFADGCPNY